MIHEITLQPKCGEVLARRDRKGKLTHMEELNLYDRRRPAPSRRLGVVLREFDLLLHQLLIESTVEIRLETAKRLNVLLSPKNEAIGTSLVRQHGVEIGAHHKLSLQLRSELETQQKHHYSHRLLIGLLCECLCLLWEEVLSKSRRLDPPNEFATYLACYLLAWRTFPLDHDIPLSVMSILKSWVAYKDPNLRRILLQSDLTQRLREAAFELPRCHSIHLAILDIIKDLSLQESSIGKLLLHSELYAIVLDYFQDDQSQRMSETILYILWAWSAVDQLAQRMAVDPSLWDVLRTVCCTLITPESMTLHRIASSTIGCLVTSWSGTPSASTESPPYFVQDPWLLRYILHALRNETDSDLRRRNARILRCVASCDWGRQYLQQHSESPNEVMTVLLRMLRDAHSSVDIRCLACQTIATMLPWEDESWSVLAPCLETILVHLIEDSETPAKLLLVACELLHSSLIHSKWKRRMQLSHGFSERLLTVQQENSLDPHYHSTISTLLLRQVKDGASIGALTNFVNNHILEMVAIFLSSSGRQYELSQRNALELVATLLLEGKCTHLLAENEHLLSALVGFCLTTTSGESKDQAKQLILQLVPEL